MKKITFLFLLAGFSFMSALADEPIKKPAYYLNVAPQGASDTYIMKVNEVKTFSIQGLKQEQGSKDFSDAGISAAWWQYDMRFLDKIGSNKDSITLRAIRGGISELIITADINSHHFSKAFTIIVQEK